MIGKYMHSFKSTVLILPAQVHRTDGIHENQLWQWSLQEETCYSMHGPMSFISVNHHGLKSNSHSSLEALITKKARKERQRSCMCRDSRKMEEYLSIRRLAEFKLHTLRRDGSTLKKIRSAYSMKHVRRQVDKVHQHATTDHQETYHRRRLFERQTCTSLHIDRSHPLSPFRFSFY